MNWLKSVWADVETNNIELKCQKIYAGCLKCKTCKCFKQQQKLKCNVEKQNHVNWMKLQPGE